MTTFTFAPATREKAFARIAFEGPEGSGKTYTSMTLAETLAGGKRFAVIDTERGSASKYARGNSGVGFDFDVLALYSFDPRDLPKALAAAQSAGYPVVIVDSLSHFWSGKGGMLELVDAVGKRAGSGGGFGGWKEARPWERDMIDALLAYPGHVLCTMRTKTEWLIDDSGPKKKISKIGTKAEQREGIGYEFDIIGDLDQENTLVVSKSRCPALQGQVINRPGPDVAVTILEWLNDGADAPDAASLADKAVALTTFDAARALRAEAERRGLLGASLLHPGTGAPTTLGDYIVERGVALRAAAQAPATPVQPKPAVVERQESQGGDGSGRGAAENVDQGLTPYHGEHGYPEGEGPAAEERQAALDEMNAVAASINFADGLAAQFVTTFGHGIEQGTAAEFREATALMRGSAAA